VESAQEILQTLRLAAEASPGADRDTIIDDPLLTALGHDPVGLDLLSARTGWPASTLAARLLELELQGLVARLPGGLYQRQQDC
jgi:DNA processing protein